MLATQQQQVYTKNYNVFILQTKSGVITTMIQCLEALKYIQISNWMVRFFLLELLFVIKGVFFLPHEMHRRREQYASHFSQPQVLN